ncbi:MAG: PIN domain-containing protein [Nitrospira sp.]|jgi:predicted nucleic acid-binding protein|nr:PIN domain-containing protein [Nitrospira sp.]
MQRQAYRVVLDTNQIIAAGTRWLDQGQPEQDNNISRRVLIRVAESHRGLYCGKIIGEYLEKLVDRRHPSERVQKMITYIMGAFTRVEITTAAAPVPPTDLDDEVFILCAIDGQAHYLISEDKSLLDLKAQYAQPIIGGSEEVAKVLGA